MTVLKTHCKNTYEGNSTNRYWPWTFELPKTASGAEDTSVIHIYKTTGQYKNTSELATGSYTIDAQNKRIIYPKDGSTTKPPAAGEYITLKRILPELQEMDLENQGAFKAETLETEADDLEMQIQQIQEQADRAICVPWGDTRTPEQYAKDIFSAADRAESAASAAESSAQSAAASAASAAASAKFAADTVAGFDAHAEAKKQEFDEHAAGKTQEFDEHAQAKIDILNPYSFGRFEIRDTNLYLDHFGRMDSSQMYINSTGNLIFELAI